MKRAFAVVWVAAFLLVMVLSVVPTPTQAAVTRFLTLTTGIGCDQQRIASSTGCWSTLSGGTGGASVPGVGDTARLDALSGTTSSHAYMEASMHVQTWDETGYLGWTHVESAFGAGNTLTVDGNLEIEGQNFLMGSGNAGGGTGKLVVGGTLTVANFATLWLSVGPHQIGGNYTTTGGFVNREVSTVRFTGSGTLTVRTTETNFYNLAINLGTNRSYCTDGVRVINNLWVNGTLFSGCPTNNPLALFKVFGQFGGRVSLGPSANLLKAGNLQIIAERDNNPIPAGTYQHLNILSDTPHTVSLEGPISTPRCAPQAAGNCSILISGWSPGDTITFFTNGQSITAGGTLWVGDITRNAIVHFSSSAVTAYGGFDTVSQSVSFLESGTFTLFNPLTCSDTIVAYTQEVNGIVHAGTATMSVTGCAFLNIVAAGSQILYAESSRWTVTGNAGCRGPLDSVFANQSSWSIGGTWSPDGSLNCVRPGIVLPQSCFGQTIFGKLLFLIIPIIIAAGVVMGLVAKGGLYSLHDSFKDAGVGTAITVVAGVVLVIIVAFLIDVLIANPVGPAVGC